MCYLHVQKKQKQKTYVCYHLFIITEENLELICDLDGVGLLISTISTHSKNSKVVKNACLALASLVEVDGKGRSIIYICPVKKSLLL